MPEPENKELIKSIRECIDQRGKIPFAEFMDLALYHPQHGYYNSPREKIGPEGDYYTSPNIHPIFGHLLARQLYEMWKLLEHPFPFTIAEMGGGKGLLCTDILHYSREHLPEFYENILYLLAEKSPAFKAEQRVLLAAFAESQKIKWVGPERLLSDEEPFTGCLLSNELIDALPVHLVQKEKGQLAEIYVTHQNDALGEITGLPSTPALEEYFHSFGSPLQDGQRAEVNLKALEWLEGVSRCLHRGFVLTIDYGYEAGELYHPDRREGTLLCYFRHTTSSNPYQHIGHQDITAHVNFSALIKKGETLGLQKAGYTEQYKFLAALGLLQDLENFEKTSSRSSGPDFFKNKLAMKSFLVPGGMGTLFKVLAQSKGLGDTILSGFQDPFQHC